MSLMRQMTSKTQMMELKSSHSIDMSNENLVMFMELTKKDQTHLMTLIAITSILIESCQLLFVMSLLLNLT